MTWKLKSPNETLKLENALEVRPKYIDIFPFSVCYESNGLEKYFIDNLKFIFPFQ